MYFICPGRRTLREMGAVVILRSLGILWEGPLNPPKGDFEDPNYLMKHLILGGRNYLRKSVIKRICNLSEAKVPLRGIRGPYSHV